jgi:rhamnogalacturonyl hydrolase YesR
LSDLADIFYVREFQINDSISLNKFLCPENELLITKLDDEDNVILYCVCCNYQYTPGEETLRLVKKWVDEVVAS